MASVNLVVLVGQAGRDAELRTLPSGKAMATCSIAVSTTIKGDKSTQWFDVVIWDRYAETVAPMITRGVTVYVQGRLQTRTWEDKDGAKRSKTEVVAEKIQVFKAPLAATAVEDAGDEASVPF